MRLGLHDDVLEFPVVVLADVVLALQPLLLGLQLLLLAHLEVRLERVEHGGADQQVGERADDQGQGPHVLPLHGAPEPARVGLMSPRIRRECAAATARAVATVAVGKAWARALAVERPRVPVVAQGEAQQAAGAP